MVAVVVEEEEEEWHPPEPLQHSGEVASTCPSPDRSLAPPLAPTPRLPLRRLPLSTLFELRWGTPDERALPLFSTPAASDARTPRSSEVARLGGVRYFADPDDRKLWFNSRNAEDYFSLPQRVGTAGNPAARPVVVGGGKESKSTEFIPVENLRAELHARRAGGHRGDHIAERRSAFLADARMT